MKTSRTMSPVAALKSLLEVQLLRQLHLIWEEAPRCAGKVMQCLCETDVKISLTHKMHLYISKPTVSKSHPDVVAKEPSEFINTPMHGLQLAFIDLFSHFSGDSCSRGSGLSCGHNGTIIRMFIVLFPNITSQAWATR